ncbi:MAG: hypothetical protein V2A34_09960 [Lentisphaerota bacterium]
MNRDRPTIRTISQTWKDEALMGKTLSLWMLGDLCDDFRQRCSTPEEQRALVQETPYWLDVNTHADCNAYLAAVAETLCREAALPPPAWTESPLCYMHRPWFAGGLETLKAILLVESPVPFRRRNLFVSANALSRV